MSKYLRFIFSKTLLESCSYISTLRSKYLLFPFAQNLQLSQKLLQLDLRKFDDLLHFIVDGSVHLLWLPVCLKFNLASALSPPLILRKSTFGFMND